MLLMSRRLLLLLRASALNVDEADDEDDDGGNDGDESAASASARASARVYCAPVTHDVNGPSLAAADSRSAFSEPAAAARTPRSVASSYTGMAAAAAA